MKMKICPLCDSEMKKAHYCDNCKSFIWRPEVLDIHYNAETRGLGETDCAYGSSHDEYDHAYVHNKKQTDDRKKGKRNDRAKTYQELFGESAEKAKGFEWNIGQRFGKTNESDYESDSRRSNAEETWRRMPDSESKRGKGHKKSSSMGALSRILTIIVVLNVIGALFGSLETLMENRSHSFSDFGNNIEDVIENLLDSQEAEVRVPEPEPEPAEEADDNYRILSDEELIDYPHGCNGYSHFEMTGDAMNDWVGEWIYEHYGVWPEAELLGPDNYVFTYDSGDSYVYLEQARYFQLPYATDDFKRYYIEFDSDTVTDQIHSVYADLEEADEIKILLTDVVPMLDPSVTESDAKAAAEWILDNMEDSYSSMELNNLYINVLENSDGGWWMDIFPAY